MRIQPRAEYLIVGFICGLFLPAPARSQAGAGPIRPASAAVSSSSGYPDTPQGLRQLLTDAIAASGSGDQDRLDALVKDLEIPDYEKWFTETFGTEKGQSWAEPYGKDLEENEQAFKRMCALMAMEGGRVVTRKINDSPDPRMTVESGLVASLQRPVDIFFAGWKDATTSADSPGDSIGYFLFIGGKFRWDSTILPLRARAVPVQRAGGDPSDPGDPNVNKLSAPGRDGVRPPVCVYCPSPAYPDEARGDKVEGAVILKITVLNNGRVRDIQLVRGLGSGLDEAAIQAVWNWQFKPATDRDGHAITTPITIEVNFRLLK